jgi:hypothetical protein
MLRRNFKSAVVPLLLIWLALHAVLLAVLLGSKFLLGKSAAFALLLLMGAVFLFAMLRAKPRKLSHSPAA